MKKTYSSDVNIENFFHNGKVENPLFLKKHLITYIGNKRKLLNLIEKSIKIIKSDTGKEKFSFFDGFSGSGVVSRALKQHANLIISNDLEPFTVPISKCFLSNTTDIDSAILNKEFNYLNTELEDHKLKEGFITELYSPKDENNINYDDRVFYTRRNAMYLDTARQLMEELEYKNLFLAPLLSKASIHVNTSGVFKGFYKDKNTKKGKFGGTNSNALTRIKSNIYVEKPVLSNFNVDYRVYNDDVNEVVDNIPNVDIAYYDPPYNQHPYGSNYFMLNLITENKRPSNISKVSGIPKK
ncbi:MAG: DNA adenine methylase [bacterium]